MNVLQELKSELIKAIAFLKEDNKEQFETIVLSEDGVKFSDGIAIGSKAEKVNTDGTLEPLVDGDYSFNDKAFSVKDGVIASIEGEPSQDNEKPINAENTPQDKTPQEGNNNSGDNTANAAPDFQDQIDNLKNELDGIKQVLEQIVSQLQGVATQEYVEQFAGEVRDLNETIIKLSKIPVETSKTNKKPVVKDRNDVELMSFLKSISK